MSMLSSGLRSRDIIDRKAVENAIVIVYAMGGSTSQPPIPPLLSLSIRTLLLLVPSVARGVDTFALSSSHLF